MREKQIGAYIAQKRRERGLTQDELGDRLGITGQAVSKWERGLSFPNLDTVHNLANVLLCSTENILNAQDSQSFSSEKGCKTTASEGVVSSDSFLESIELDDLGYHVSPLLFGGNLEHSRSAISGGLSAQMLRNRKFAGMPNSFRGNAAAWFIIGEKTFAMVGSDQTDHSNIAAEAIVTSYTRHSDLGYHMQRHFECNSQLVHNLYGETAGIGQHGLYIDSKKEYAFRIVLSTDREAAIEVSLTSRNGQVYTAEHLFISGNQWKTYTATLKPNTSDADADIRITFTEKARIIIGAVSLMPTDNFYGMRWDVIERLKEMKLKMLRWPGGNFAGEYNWLDGLLPCDMRAPFESHILHLTQPHTFGYDFHEICTDDFIALCREIGAEPSITLNQTWNTPKENAAWVEYCNGDETTKYGKMRIDRGFSEPYNVRYWSLGNEAGYGHMEGDNTPSGYRRIAEENADALLKTDPNLILCSSGYHPQRDWAQEANNPLARKAPLAALHNYCNAPTYADETLKKQELHKRLKGVEECRRKIHKLRSYLSPDVSIAFDEWNCWYSWYRPQDTFAGLFAARMLHMLITEQKSSNVCLSALYQPVNEGGICVLPDKATLTPVGQVFGLISEHSGGRVRYASESAVVSERDHTLTVTLINDSYDAEKTFLIKHRGTLTGIQLTAQDIGPYTDFSPKQVTAENEDGTIHITLPPLSVAQLHDQP